MIFLLALWPDWWHWPLSQSYWLFACIVWIPLGYIYCRKITLLPFPGWNRSSVNFWNKTHVIQDPKCPKKTPLPKMKWKCLPEMHLFPVRVKWTQVNFHNTGGVGYWAFILDLFSHSNNRCFVIHLVYGGNPRQQTGGRRRKIWWWWCCCWCLWYWCAKMSFLSVPLSHSLWFFLSSHISSS